MGQHLYLGAENLHFGNEKQTKIKIRNMPVLYLVTNLHKILYKSNMCNYLTYDPVLNWV